MPSELTDYSAIGLLVIAVGWLAKLLIEYLNKDKATIKNWRETEQKRLEDCERQHKESIEKVTELTGSVEFMKGRMTTFESMTLDAIKERERLQETGNTLVKKVDETIKHTIENKDINERILKHIVKE